ncbi:MAG: nickel-dependent hydrogenase large subunit [Hyphomicrobiaceae bacterium]|nr:nickel-dependent hydrogenase large subunit [Hyphomicrobiaceae bacterium]
MTVPGQIRGIRVRGEVIDQRIANLSIESSRPLSATMVLTGRPVAEALKLVPLLFPVCGRAQVIAGVRAAEAAMGRHPDPVTEAARDLLVLAEQCAGIAWRIEIDWALLCRRSPDATTVAAVRESAQEVRFALFGDLPFDQIGAAPVKVDRVRLLMALALLQARLASLFPEALQADGLMDLELAMAKGRSIPARLVHAARLQPDAALGNHDRDYFDEKCPMWFGDRLGADGNFPWLPTIDGRTAEVGPLAGMRHDLVVEALVGWGAGLATRLLAASLDVFTVPTRMQELTRRIVDGLPMGRSARLGEGTGSGIAETARGPLAHWVRVDGDRVIDWRAVAPTEWNFHPQGPFVRALARARALSDPEHQIRVLAASFDPCVPVTVDLVRA